MIKRSSCLIEALKAKVSNSNVTIFVNCCFPIPHCYWKDGEKFFHFSALDKNLPTKQMLYFEGKVVKYLWHDKNPAVKTIKLI